MNSNFSEKPSDKKQNLHPLILALMVAGGILFGYLLSVNTVNKPSVFSDYEFNKLDQVLNYLENNYVDSLNRKDIEEKAIEEILADLDPHSFYIPASETQDIADDMNGNFEGIGVQFLIKKDTINIEETIKDGPSEKLGIEAGDKIIFIEDSLIAGVGITNNDVIKMLKGPKGTKVKIKVLRNGELIPYVITRDKIPLYSVDATYMVDKQTGYIKINRFSATTYEEFMDGVSALKKKGLQNLIIDLRGNPGGYLQSAVLIADELLAGEKLVVYTEGLHQEKYEYTTNRKGIFEEGKLIVLIDQNSASASEILAGAVQDWDRGTVIGRRSYGKGLVQDQHAFPDNSALRLTIARYYTPSGRSIQKPYDDKDAYYNEVNERYESGELLGVDSNIIHHDTIKYYTLVEKREVYGGGGIEPDIFVPIDTAYANFYVLKLRRDLSAFINVYVNENKSSLDKFNVNNFASGFVVTDKIYDQFIAYAQQMGYDGEISSNPIYKDGIKLLLKANIAKKLYDNEGFYKAVNFKSHIIEESLKQINK